MPTSNSACQRLNITYSMIETMPGSWYLLKMLGLITIVVDNSNNHSKGIKPVNLKVINPDFTGRTDAEGPMILAT